MALERLEGGDEAELLRELGYRQVVRDLSS